MLDRRTTSNTWFVFKPVSSFKPPVSGLPRAHAEPPREWTMSIGEKYLGQHQLPLLEPLGPPVTMVVRRCVGAMIIDLADAAHCCACASIILSSSREEMCGIAPWCVMLPH